MAIDTEALTGSVGIYRIVNAVTGIAYIGQSGKLRKRLFEHRASLRRGKHDNAYLQRAFNKYGEDAFLFEVIEYCSAKDLTKREQYWLDTVGLCRLYNLSPSAGRSQLGIKRSPETCALISKAKRGRYVSEETRQRLREYFTGRKMPPRSLEWRLKQSELRKGKPLSENARKRAAEVNSVRVYTPEWRAKLSAAKLKYWAAKRDG